MGIGFLPSEVDDMLPSVAAILCNKKVRNGSSSSMVVRVVVVVVVGVVVVTDRMMIWTMILRV